MSTGIISPVSINELTSEAPGLVFSMPEGTALPLEAETVPTQSPAEFLNAIVASGEESTLYIAIPHLFIGGMTRSYALKEFQRRQASETLSALYAIPADRIGAATLSTGVIEYVDTSLTGRMSREIAPAYTEDIQIADLRIRTHNDRPVTVFDAPGKIREIPHPGTVYSFPLRAVTLLLSKAPEA